MILEAITVTVEKNVLILLLENIRMGSKQDLFIFKAACFSKAWEASEYHQLRHGGLLLQYGQLQRKQEPSLSVKQRAATQARP